MLPDAAQPFSKPSRQAAKLEETYSYPQSIDGELMPMGSISKQAGHTQWVQLEAEGKPAYLPLPLVVKKAERIQQPNLPIGQEIVDKDHPLPLDYQPSDLADLNSKWNYQTGAKFQLRTEAAKMAEKMLNSAKQNGIELRIASAYRSAISQRHNYLRKIKQTNMDQKVIAKPGHSEHQLGTAVDVCTLDPKTSLQSSFANTAEGQWLRDNCREFGFVLSYTPENAEKKGYIPEPWHARYVGKIAQNWK